MNYGVYNAVTNHLSTVVNQPSGQLPDGYVFVPESDIPANADRTPRQEPRQADTPTRLYSLRAVFALHGLETKIDTAISSLPEPQRSIAKAHWNYGDTISRTHPLVSSLANMLGLSDAEVDEIFSDAQTVEAGGVPDIKPEEVSMWQRLLNLFS